MDAIELKDRVGNLSIWKKGEQRAPHKPLLILYALGQLQNKKKRLIPYEEIRVKLKELLIEFGPLRKSYHPEQPFIRLANDGIWELNKTVDTKHFRDKQIRDERVIGGFTEEVYSLLSRDQSLVQEVAEIVLNQHFPETVHEDILDAIGLDFNYVKKRKRDPEFRRRILRAYGYSCAICGFNVRLSDKLVGVEAAHIKWHQAGGPDKEDNGLALCSLHHKLFDRGVFTISDTRKMIVSQDAHGTIGFDEFLMRYHGKIIRQPIQTVYEPSYHYLDWHVREVFRGPQYN